MHASTDSKGARLVASAEIRDAASLVLEYSFQNLEPGNTYVFNGLYSGITSGVYRTDPDLVNVELRLGRVVLSKKAVPLPPGIAVEVLRVPTATRVAPGAVLHETLTLALPLRPWTPYARPREENLEAAASQLPLWFEVGFFRAPPEGDALARPVRTAQGEALFFDSFPAESQDILSVGPLLVEVPVRRPAR